MPQPLLTYEQLEKLENYNKELRRQSKDDSEPLSNLDDLLNKFRKRNSKHRPLRKITNNSSLIPINESVNTSVELLR